MKNGFDSRLLNEDGGTSSLPLPPLECPPPDSPGPIMHICSWLLVAGNEEQSSMEGQGYPTTCITGAHLKAVTSIKLQEKSN